MMLLAVLVIFLIGAALTAAGKLHETRYQLGQARSERDAYYDAYQRLLMSAIIAGRVENAEKELHDVWP
jgi:Flp pilus assembly protein TadD